MNIEVSGKPELYSLEETRQVIELLEWFTHVKPIIMSPQMYDRIEASIKHYKATGELDD